MLNNTEWQPYYSLAHKKIVSHKPTDRLPPVVWAFTFYDKTMENQDGFWVSGSLIEKVGVTDAVLLSAYYSGFHVSKNKIRRLESKGYLISQKLSDDKAYKILKTIDRPDWVGGLECEWCGCRSISIQMHHFPIRRKDGGEETVNICAGCHTDFHALTDIRVKSFSKEISPHLQGEGYDN